MDYLERNINDCSTTVLLNNFNIYVNEEDNHNSITFSNFLEIFGLWNWVSFPTHRLDNTLDILTHEVANTITGVRTRKTSFRQSRSTFQHHKWAIYHKKKSLLIQNTKENQHKSVQRRPQVSTVQYWSWIIRCIFILNSLQQHAQENSQSTCTTQEKKPVWSLQTTLV